MTARVWIAQCLCPARHCITALVEESAEGSEPLGLEQKLRAAIADLTGGPGAILNPHCGLCGAPQAGWTYEVRPTVFRELAVALGHLRELEARQARVRALFGDLEHRQRPN